MTTLYIAPTATGTADGSSPENAGSIADISSFIASAGPGGEIILLADRGAYQLTARPPSIFSGGSEDQPVTIRGADAAGNPMAAEFVGTRSDPWDPAGASGPEGFRLMNGADNLVFKDMSFSNMGYGVFRVGADLSNLTIEHVQANNVERFFENYESGENSSASVVGLTIRDVQIEGFSRGAIRLQYNSSNILIEDVTADSQGQGDPSGFAIGVHLDGTVHDVVIRRVTMSNATDATGQTFWNGDGFATEGGVSNVLFEDTVSSGNTDAGYDIKSTLTKIVGAVAEDNARNYRIWAKDLVLEEVVSIDPFLRGGNSSKAHFWFAKGAQATLISPTISGDTTGFDLREGLAKATITDLTFLSNSAVYTKRSDSLVAVDGVAQPNSYTQPIKSVDYGVGVPGGTTEAPGGDQKVTYYAVSDVDHVIVAAEGADTIRGRGGNDMLSGGSGDDVLLGGAGDDVLMGGSGGDVLVGGDGFDTASFLDSATGVKVSLQGGVSEGGAAGDLLDGVEALVGSVFADTLIGDSGDNLISGRGGADVLDGGEGIDTLDYSTSASAVSVDLDRGDGFGGDAEGDQVRNFEIVIGSAFGDKLKGGAGSDRFVGGAGADGIDGGAGRDIVDYRFSTASIQIDLDTNINTGGDAEGDRLSQVEVIIGSAFSDRLRGDSGANVLVGAAGDDELLGQVGDDLLVGGLGADILTGGDGIDTVDYSSNQVSIAIDLETGIASGGEADGDLVSSVENVRGTRFFDILRGNAQANRLDGGEGDDRLTGGAGGDVLDGGLGFDIADYSTSLAGVTVDFVNGAGGGDASGDTFVSIEKIVGSSYSDFVRAGATALILDGGAGDDVLVGAAGDDWLIGGSGGDLLDGGNGKDTVDYSASGEAVEIDLGLGRGVSGQAAGDVLLSIEAVIGSQFADTLRGDALDNIFIGGLGADVLEGFGGQDSVDYSRSLAGIAVDLAAGSGLGGEADGDRLSGIEVIVATNFADQLTGDAAANRFIGGLGADVIDGGDGMDTIDYSQSATGVVVNLLTNANTGGEAAGDQLYRIENVVGSALDDKIVGNAETNKLVGGSGADTLDGGAGTDLLIGEAGNDTYIVDSETDIVIEEERGGTDRIQTTLSTYTIRDNIEQLQYLGTGSFTGYGNEADNTFYGNSGIDTFFGYGGDDKFQGSFSDDTFYGGSGFNSVDYSSAKNAIIVNLTTNINRGSYADGDRLFDVQQVSASNYNDDLTGDGAANTFYGRNGVDVLRGLGGNDRLDGGAGADVLIGGEGDDTFYVENAQDSTVESALEGVDIVRSSLASWTLSEHVENLSASLQRSFVGTGNGLNNVITGNISADALYGLDGSDTLIGGSGADLLDGGTGSDTVSYASSLLGVAVNLGSAVQNSGDAQGDRLIDVENVIGSARDDRIEGNSLANELFGLAGNDLLRGGEGDDVLVGGAGDDLLSGGEGNDLATFSGARANYTIRERDGYVEVRDLRAIGEGYDRLEGIERLSFKNGTVSLVDALAGLPNQAPIGIESSILGVRSDVAAGIVVGVLQGLDSDEDDRLTYLLLDNEAGIFQLDPVTGHLVLAKDLTPGVLSYRINARVTDTAGASVDRLFDIFVNRPPQGSLGVSGVAEEGETLGATASFSDEDGVGAVTYQWFRNGIAVDGATNVSYMLAQSDVGSEITVRATYLDGRGWLESVLSAPTSPIKNVNDTAAGYIQLSGEASQGETLSVIALLSDEDGLGTIVYQWYRAGVALPGANGTTYDLTEADVGFEISVAAGFVDGQGTVEVVTSSATLPIRNVNDLPSGELVVMGAATEGGTLSASGTLSDADGTGPVSLQWVRDGVAISGATGGSYTLVQADVGTSISVVATYVDGRGTVESVWSPPTALVTNVNDAPAGQIIVTGDAVLGTTLFASHQLVDEDGMGEVTYQWLRSGLPISGASGKTYTLAEADVGSTISVTANYIDGFGTAEQVTSSSSVPVTEAPAMASFEGTAQADIFTAGPSAAWTIHGYGGDDILTGSGGADLIFGGEQSDKLSGRGGDDMLDGGAGNDIVAFSGARGDYTFELSGAALMVTDRRMNEDGADRLTNIEKVQFQDGSWKPIGAVESGYSTESFAGTSARDLFLFDTAIGLSVGSDAIRAFGSGDRIVTTSAIYDSNNDGLIKSNSSDRFVLASVVGAASSATTGNLKLYGATGSIISTIRLVGTEVHEGVAFYVYAAANDTTTGTGLSFAVADTTVPTLAVTTSRESIGPGDSATLTLHFSEAPVGFEQSDIAAESGKVTAFTSTNDPRVFTVTYQAASNTYDPSMIVAVASGSFTDAAGNAGQGASINLAVDTRNAPAEYVGDGEANIFDAPTDAAWTISGLGGADRLTGGAADDRIYGGDQNDRLNGRGGNDLLDGGSGIDTVFLGGRRSDYAFSRSEGGLVASDHRTSGDGLDTLIGIEDLVFAGGDGRPAGAIKTTYNSEAMQGTSAEDVFFFDTALGVASGGDAIRNFGTGDRIVTTSAIFDSNNDGIIKANSSDKYLLPSVEQAPSAESTGTLKIYAPNGGIVSSLHLVSIEVYEGVSYHIYGKAGDLVVSPDLFF